MKRTSNKLLLLSASALFAFSLARATPVFVNNFSFESQTLTQGQSLILDPPSGPTGWHDFHVGTGSSWDVGLGRPGMEYSPANPLASPADGNNYLWLNDFNGNGSQVTGVYQDIGQLKPDATYTLTVAIGYRADTPPNAQPTWSPGIISLVNGTDNTGTVLAIATNLPATANTWQSYSVTYTTGPSVSGDLTIVLSVVDAQSIQADFDNVRLDGPAGYAPPPILVQDTSPSSATVLLGSNAVFTAAYSNVPPVVVQWQQIVSGSPGVTNNINNGIVTVTNNGVVTSTLTLTNLQVTDAGSYLLKGVNATNIGGIAYSTPALLTVVPPITWYGPGAYNGSFSNDSVLALAGPVANEVYGVDFGGSGAVTTDNGYAFADYTSGNMSLNGGGSMTVNNSFLAGIATTGDSGLDTLLLNGLQGSTANAGMLNNLTVGQSYTVLVLLDDTRGPSSGTTPSGTTFHVTDGVTISPQQRYAYDNGVPNVGGYIMGTFTAKSTNQPLTVLTDDGSGQYNNSQYNAILVMKGIAPPPHNPPTLNPDIHPLLSEVATGGSVTLSVGGAGSVPLSYQWYNQGGPISNQTNSSYTFSAVSGTNSYYVILTNAYGSVVSTNALVISSTNVVTVKNFSFEDDVASGPGTVVRAVPADWTQFNQAAAGDIGSQWAGLNNGSYDYTVNTPLAAPAEGNQYCYINMFSSTPVGGVYQDVGPLKTNTAYTLTVAIGSRNDRINSPGVVSLVRGTNNAGVVLATTGGLPSTTNTWQDYTVSFTNGTSTGDLTIVLSVSGAGTIQADFDNVRLAMAPAAGPPPPAALHNPSFEADNNSVPAYWTEFAAQWSQAATASGVDFTTPLLTPADGTNYFAINEDSGGQIGGIYQVYGTLQPNTTYRLTVAIGNRADTPPNGQATWSPGIISLINGDDNTGIVLATTSGVPTTTNTWQDYTVSYTSGPTVSGDLTVELSVAPAASIQADFDNVRLAVTNAPAYTAPVFNPLKIAGSNLILTGSGTAGDANAAYTLLTATNLAPPISWTTNTTGTMDGTGAFSNSIPLGSGPVRFFRVRVP